ncbi:MAG TPA: exodeoxyribonuclease V subunit gamma [Deltaproteobacteria bacterium]|nr:exodeoxyribonuclease V subunit gamma [Deltaproteobacteria bacterium]HRW79507.1 exodeoxyribonuclease V subunit gamma [Desulfomonilia bacterium]HNQ84574.1 exodeoxyribonuclease V subunit gamma [Deltaproteobacteria bacterium]HNS88985.1 exodeoxyribonuclease V subunit gamma [Deltaproteobacteria bacterium]HOA44096.1 exodeoxyribonuclease V subunit gamma [Deltaproteobacteria bacterium]
MPNLKLIESNRLEVLSQALATSLSTPLSSPLTPELIVVQSRGMQRWLSMELARMHGICSNIKWPFPNTFVLDMFSRILPGITQPPLFDKDSLTLRIMDCLPDLLTHRHFARIKDYLENDEQGMKLYQFSSMMAGIYDQYVIFRPELILGWEDGKSKAAYPENWQAILWRKVIERSDPHHRARLKQLFAQEIIHADISMLPERVSIFGISYLPAFHLEVLKGLSACIDVGIYCLNPCREYWADIIPERRMARITEKDMHWESCNDLLAGMGRLGRNFLDMVLELDPEQVDLFEETEGITMLSQVQADILNLRPPGEEGVREVTDGDRSIQVHSCHSPMRETEVLLDTLLDLFEKDPDLEPRDILVMAPDIEAYAPFIRAVFDMDRDDARRIPYSISDRSFRRSSRLADALMAVLDLAGRRYEASLVMDLLDKEPVRTRFDLDEEAVSEIHAWVTGAGIRWGRDGNDKVELGLPGFAENTWQFGLRRLLLGYAMAEGEGLFAGIAPFEGMDPGSAELLGRFTDFVEKLFAAVDELRQERGPAQWSEVLLRIIDDLFTVDEDGVQEMLHLKAVVRDLEKTGQDAGFRGRLSCDVVRQHLAKAFGHAAEGSGFLERGVTFCSMLPMRSIPLKVICLMGMNHEAFPRRDYTSGLDLTAMDQRRGDRSRRDDDLYLFLEALLSARNVLSISYIGQGIQDNAPIPPSVVVSSLLEYLDRSFVNPGVARSHCLQAFSPKYFTAGTGLFSYSQDNALAARALRRQGQSGARSAELADPGEEFRTVDLERLLEFFRGPACFFLRHRLGATLPWEDETLLDREPFELAGLERYGLHQRILTERLAGKSMDADLARLRAEGVLPHGVPGELALAGLAREIDAFYPLIERAMEGRDMVRKDLALPVDGFTVTGSVNSLDGAGFLSFRYAKVTGNDLMRAWLSLLLLQAADPAAQATALHIHREGLTRINAVEEPLTVLKEFLDVYRQGLCKPVHLFPKSSHAYAEAMKKYGKDKRATQEARRTWEGSRYQRGEAGDAALLLCFAGTDPLDDEFRELALAVYGPILDAMGAGT